jgi:hypothetical protein
MDLLNQIGDILVGGALLALVVIAFWVGFGPAPTSTRRKKK